MDIDHVLRKEPFMKCLTPSHDEEIESGISCSLEDTLKIMAKDDQETTDLLGTPQETNGSKINSEVISALYDKLKTTKKGCDLSFLKAQMYKNYRMHIDPSRSGNRATEEIVRGNGDQIISIY